MTDRYVREAERRMITGRGRTAWRDDELAGRAPMRIKIGPRAVGWRLSDLEAWVAGTWTPAQGVTCQAAADQEEAREAA